MQCTLAVVLCVLIAAPACPAPPNPDPKNACAYVMASSLQPTELCVAPAYGCVASFSRSRHSCNFACSAANMACTAAFDDAFDDGRCPPGRQVLPEKELQEGMQVPPDRMRRSRVRDVRDTTNSTIVGSSPFSRGCVELPIFIIRLFYHYYFMLTCVRRPMTAHLFHSCIF